MRQAVSISPSNPKVKSTFLKIQDHGNVHDLVRLCQRLVIHHEKSAGEEAIRKLERVSSNVPDEAGETCIKLLFEDHSTLESADGGELFSLLLKRCLGARRFLASHIKDAFTRDFGIIWIAGDEAVIGLVIVILDKRAWKSQESRRKDCARDGLQLLLAKLIEAGQDDRVRAMKGIARLLVTEGPQLQQYIEADSFHAILSCLDMRSSQELRSQATLATAKFLEYSDERGQRMLTEFVVNRVTKGRSEDLLIAFSAAAAVFPIVPSIAANLFLAEGFVQSLVPLLHRKAKSLRTEQAALEMLSAACIDKNCRDAIAQHCTEWLDTVVDEGNDKSLGLAAVVLAKISGPGNTAKESKRVNEDQNDIEQLVARFKKLLETKDETAKQRSLEGLAYASLQPKIKRGLANDSQFLKDLLETLKTNDNQTSKVFGALTILSNITAYAPNVSEEQKRISQLKAYANASKAALDPDPLDLDGAVDPRCRSVAEAGFIPVLVDLLNTLKPVALKVDLQIIFSLSKMFSNRGGLAQNGAIKALAKIYASLDTAQLRSSTDSAMLAAHGLARILISVDPNLAFVGTNAVPMSSAIRPLLALLTPPLEERERDLLPVFESLLALTNLASVDDETRAAIIRLCFPNIETLLFQDNKMLRRASVELVCNLMAGPEGVALFVDGSSKASTRLQILLALADVDDFETRRAAGGALAMLTEWDYAVDAIVAREKGVKVLLNLCRDDEDEVKHRGAVCVKNVISAPGQVGVRGLKKVRDEGGVKVMKGLLRDTRNPEVLPIGVEVLKKLI